MPRLERLSKRIFRALHLTGYARMDFRLRADGQLFVLEANANPNLSAAEDFAQSALTAGIGYGELLRRIIQLGASYPAAWRARTPRAAAQFCRSSRSCRADRCPAAGVPRCRRRRATARPRIGEHVRQISAGPFAEPRSIGAEPEGDRRANIASATLNAPNSQPPPTPKRRRQSDQIASMRAMSASSAAVCGTRRPSARMFIGHSPRKA